MSTDDEMMRTPIDEHAFKVLSHLMRDLDMRSARSGVLLTFAQVALRMLAVENSRLFAFYIGLTFLGSRWLNWTFLAVLGLAAYGIGALVADVPGAVAHIVGWIVGGGNYGHE